MLMLGPPYAETPSAVRLIPINAWKDASGLIELRQ
jgi:hypothetical protein